MRQTLKRTVVADKHVAHFCQVLCSLVAVTVMVLGIWRLAAQDLDEAQLFSAMTGTLTLSGIFVILAFLCRIWRGAA